MKSKNMRITKEQVDQVFSSKKTCERIAAGLSSYQWLQKNVGRVASEDFQKLYARFYGINAAHKDSQWRKQYFGMMQEAKIMGAQLSFRKILDLFKAETGKYEASFVSKLIATLDPDKQVIDRHVLRNFGLKLPGYNIANRAEKIDEIYNLLGLEYKKMLDAKPVGEYVIGRYVCRKFDSEFQSSKITRLKKIDLVFWQIRI